MNKKVSLTNDKRRKESQAMRHSEALGKKKTEPPPLIKVQSVRFSSINQIYPDSCILCLASPIHLY